MTAVCGNPEALELHELAEESNTLHPGKTVFMVLIADNADGTIDPDSQAGAFFLDLDEAVKHAKAQCDEDMPAFVYECRPVKKASVGRVKVTDMKTKR